MNNTKLKQVNKDGSWESNTALLEARALISPEILDFEHLDRYTNGDMALEQELLELFQTQALLQFENIDVADNKPDWVMAVHTLKGCALGVGAVQVAGLTSKLEVLGFDADKEEKQAKISQLKYAIAKCIVTVRELTQLA